MGLWQAGPNVVVLDAKRFVEFHGQKFTPPDLTGKVQIFHGK
jgi:hypothetical protein